MVHKMLVDKFKNSSDEKSVEKRSRYIGGIIKRVNNFNYETLEGRQTFHKTIYLIQAYGIFLGCHFSWQNCGVYSPQLAKFGILFKDRIDTIKPSKFTSPDIEKKFLEFLEYIKPLKTNLDLLRIISGLHYIKKLNPEWDKGIIEVFLSDNTGIELNTILQGWRYLDKLR